MLQLHEVSKTYSGGVLALNHVSLQIEQGLFGLLGPNGAGKSSLMRTLATLQQPDSGSISMRVGSGETLQWQGNDQQVRHLLGYLPQQFGVYRGISALRLLDHLALLKGIVDSKIRKMEVEALLDMVNLWERRHDQVAEFSGGMKQRFGIAQALLAQPELIVVDEPTAGLDPLERNRFHNLLAELGQQAIVILSTHIVEDVADLCDQIAILANGKVMAQGDIDTLTDPNATTIWQLILSREEVALFEEHPRLISKQLKRGQFELRFYGQHSPAPQAKQVPPALEDIYFTVLAQHQLLQPSS
ncbi:ATP-binding cassette domain-containing protein [Aliiglaciecola sp. CAU 1673]|uniref:ATP-binding cassette domain-containing protein n=1 Tax=Aliiglaciecola sp. CAU 1673 TaxID=3032595 RepID=UPI0023DC693A|nr:ATP-binding cassette domain-containing protein [Aliiglaciecola sp. CAU 1673]MDF2176732.1 ATP-binding cassette domain-containing protein [Aliiglaciecola sp. CAU 1673]